MNKFEKWFDGIDVKSMLYNSSKRNLCGEAYREGERQKQQKIVEGMIKTADGILSDLRLDGSKLLKNQAEFVARVLKTQAELIDNA